MASTNTLLTVDQITREALRILVNNLGFTKSVNRQYDESFAQSGAKIGNVLRIRKPVKYTVTTNTVALSVQDATETNATLTLDTQAHVDTDFTSQELTLDLDDFSDRILKPAMAAITNKIDFDGLGLYKKVWNSNGTPGTPPATAMALLGAGEKLDDNAAPRDGNRCMIYNPAANASMVDGLGSLFNSQSKLAENYRQGQIASNTLGFDDIAMDQNVRMHTTGAFAGAVAVNDGAIAEGDTTLIMNAFTDAAPTAKEGDVFTIPNVYSVNPQSRASTGKLMQFVVTADVTGAGNAATIAFSPSLQAAGSNQNIDALPVNGALVTFLGTASTQYPQNMGFHKDAFVLGTADLVMPSGVDFASRQVMDGISLRIIRDYDINNDLFPCRIDVLYGWSELYPELANRTWA